MRDHQRLIEELYLGNAIRTPKIVEAFRDIDRAHFVPDAVKDDVYNDIPLPIGEEQTISQPSTVAFMLELLEPQKGNKILDIGSGSGWTTALLCHIVGEEGSVLGLERLERLADFGQSNLEKMHFGPYCRIEKAGNALGMPGETFDRILVSASSDMVPEELFDQLKTGGVLVIPIGEVIYRFEKQPDGQITQQAYPGFRFVPLIYNERPE